MTRVDRRQLKAYQDNVLHLAVALLLELQKICHLDQAAGKVLIEEIVRDYRRVAREKRP